LSGQKDEPLFFSRCCLPIPVSHFHFHLAESLKNGLSVLSRRQRSPPEDCCHQEVAQFGILRDHKIADEGDDHQKVDEEKESDEV
jgi:hypothetical protein